MSIRDDENSYNRARRAAQLAAKVGTGAVYGLGPGHPLAGSVIVGVDDRGRALAWSGGKFAGDATLLRRVEHDCSDPTEALEVVRLICGDKRLGGGFSSQPVQQQAPPAKFTRPQPLRKADKLSQKHYKAAWRAAQNAQTRPIEQASVVIDDPRP